MITSEQIDPLLANGASVLDSAGERIGSLGQIYLDDKTGEPSWATVNTGLFGLSESFVPLTDANLEGDDIKVAYSKEQVKDAPKIEQEGHLDPEDERLLYEHFSITGYDDVAAEPGRVAPPVEETEHRPAEVFAGDHGDAVPTPRDSDVPGDRDRVVDVEADAAADTDIAADREATRSRRLRRYVTGGEVEATRGEGL